MGRISKSYFSILLLMIALSSLTLVGTANAQSITKPSVPEFTVKLISPPPESQQVNRTIELSIKNQPFAPNYGFFYNIRMTVNDGNWSLLYTIDDVPTQSNGEYTILSYPSDQPVVEYQYNLGDRIQDLFAGDKVDFQVQAMIGNIHRVFNPNATNQLEMYPYVFTGESSDWSSIQTITIPDTSTSASPTPTVSEFPSLALIPLSTVGLLAAELSIKIKKRQE